MQNFLRQMDMFSINQFTLYRTKEKYGTATGGVASLIIFIILAAIFINELIITFSYAQVNASSQVVIDPNPTKYEFQANPESKFMLALGIISGSDVNLQLFNVRLYNYTSKYNSSYTQISYRQIPLSPCSAYQWQGINDQITNQFESLNLKGFLCPSKDYPMELSGKFLQEQFKYLKVEVSLCQQKQKCLSGGFTNTVYNGQLPKFKIFCINTLINPSNKNGISYYVEEIGTLQMFSNNYVSAEIEFQEYTVTTDQSLMPWSSPKVQRGIFTEGVSSIENIAVETQVLASVTFCKSSRKLFVKRNYQKVTDALSFVGGLLTPLLLIFSIMAVYNKFAYEVEFGNRIFKEKGSNTMNSLDFNFLTFIKCGFCSMFKKMGFGTSWNKIKMYNKYRKESIRQLDIHLLFRKVQLFQQVCNTIFDEHHLAGLHFLSKKSLKESKKTRKRSILQDVINDNIENPVNPQVIVEKKNTNQEDYFDSCRQHCDNPEQADKEITELKRRFSQNLRKLGEQSDRGDTFSMKIMRKLNPKKVDPTLISIDLNDDQGEEDKRGQHKQEDNIETMQKICTNTELVRASIQTM